MNVLRLLIAGPLLALAHGTGMAQTSLLNAPSTDVVEAKQVYLEMDFTTNYSWQHDDSRFANYLPRAVIGLPSNLELGANLSYTRVPGGGEPLELQPNVKWQFYKNKDKGLAAAAGGLWFIPLTHRADTDTFGQCYALISKQFSGDYGPRFTGGGYTLAGAGRDLGTRHGAIAAWEQPLSKRTGFIVDWQSGYNRLGYLSPGFYITLPRNGSLSAGYAIANRGHENNALFVYYGQQF